MTKEPSKFGEAGPYMSLLFKIGTLVLCSVLGGFLIGLWLDNYLETQGTLMIAGAIMGVVIGFYMTYREIMKLND